MHKKLIMACMAIAAFAAFVIAPAASVSPVLTDPVGTALPVGTSLTGVNTGTTTFTGSGGVNVHCTTAHIVGNLTVNNGTSIKGEVAVGGAHFTGTGSGGDCTGGLGDTKVTVNSKLCFETVAGTDNVKVTGCGSKVTFTLLATPTGTPCKYEGNIENGATYATGDATVNVVSGSPAKNVDIPGDGNSIFCPTGGTLDMDFDLTTTGGGTVLVS